MPLPQRHDYAAGLHRGLRAGDIDRPRSSPPPSAGAHGNQPTSARLELVV
jgi:hypothetical protein